MTTLLLPSPTEIQAALFASDVPEDFIGSSRIRVMPVTGDAMEPTYRRGDFVVVLPVHEFRGEGTYVLDEGGGPVIYRARRGDGSLRITMDHPAMQRNPKAYPFDYFNECVIGFVVGHIVISEPHVLRKALAA